MDRVKDGMLLSADRDVPQQVLFVETSQFLKQGCPASFPGGSEALSGIVRPDDELGIPISPGCVAIRGQKVRPARGQLPGNLLDDNGNAVGVLAGLLEEVLVRNLPECFLSKFLVLADIARA
jgi:hypothetical protein